MRSVPKVCLMIAVSLSGHLLGCAAPKPQPVKTYVTKEGLIDETPVLSPAERAMRFDQAFSAGLEWVARKQYGLALGAFEEAVAMNPASVEARFNLGACYEQAGDLVKAIQLYRQVLRITPMDPQCYRNLGTSYIKMFYLERSPVWRRMAMDAWNQSLKLDPDQPNVKQYLAQAEIVD